MTIGEIVSLTWAGAGFIGISSVSIWLYRRPDSQFKLKHGEAEFSVAPSAPGTPSAAKPELEEVAEQPQRQIPATKDDAGTVSEPKQSAFARSFDYLDSGDYVSARKALQEAAREDTTTGQGRATLAFGYYQAASRGYLQAVDDLRSLAATQPDAFDVHLWLGASQQVTGDREAARVSLTRARELAGSDSERSLAIGAMATVIQKSDGLEAAVSFLVTSAREIESRAERASMVARAAKLSLDLPSPNVVRGFALLEYALELTPVDSALRFDAAYAYGENSAEATSFVHYSQLVDRHPNHAGALNNLGVAASRLGMETTAVASYREAEKRGNTLASANIAYKLLDEGFADEAKEVLDLALKEKDVHGNVLEALGAVSRTKNKDENLQKEIEKAVSAFRRLAATHGRILVESSVLHPLARKYLSGTWTLEVVSATETAFVSVLTSSFDTRDVVGARDGNLLTFSWKTRKAEKATLLGALILEKSGHGVLSIELGKLLGFTYEGEATAEPTRAAGYTEHSFVADIRP